MVGPLPSEALRWRCDLESMPFETTADLEPNVGVVGQSSAAEALSFGLEIDAPGQNIFIRGLTGTGRMTLVQRLLEQLQPECGAKTDRCYVHNFTEPARPRLISRNERDGNGDGHVARKHAPSCDDGLSG